MIAAALRFGRRHPQDKGPDIAIDMATGRAGHFGKICAASGKALNGDRSALVKRNRGNIGHVTMGAYNAVLGRACLGVADRVSELTSATWWRPLLTSWSNLPKIRCRLRHGGRRGRLDRSRDARAMASVRAVALINSLRYGSSTQSGPAGA